MCELQPCSRCPGVAISTDTVILLLQLADSQPTRPVQSTACMSGHCAAACVQQTLSASTSSASWTTPDEVICTSGTCTNTLIPLQIVEYYRKHLPVIKKSPTTFKVAFIERHHKRRIENYNELLEWCNTKLKLPVGSQFTDVNCVPLNLDHADRYLHTLAEMQTVDVLVSCRTLQYGE